MKGMSLIVKSVTRLVTAFIAIFGINLILFGHLTPGGGFPGGVVLAFTLILMVLAFGREYEANFFTTLAAGIWDGVGALTFLCVGLVGYLAGTFFVNFLFSEGAVTQPFGLFSAGSVLISNVAIGLKVGASLFLAFMAVAGFRVGPGEDKERA